MSEEIKRIRAPFDDATARSLRAGDRVLIAPNPLVETLDRGEPLPVSLEGAVVYYV